MSLQSRIDALKYSIESDFQKEIGKLLGLQREMNAGNLIECLDDGFVRLVDHMGDDSAIVQAARVSYGAGTRSINDDNGLIRYLMRHRHTSPFEMVEFKFHVRVPMDCWRQWIRHRTASVNETSTRYSEAIDSRSITSCDSWRLQSSDRKQGSSGFAPAHLQSPSDPAAYYELTGEYLTKREADLHELTQNVYLERLEAGIAREQARKDLPLSTYTEAYWKIDGHNLLHFLGLRMEAHAQLEIRTYANAIAKLIKPIIPLTWDAFENYCLNSITLSYQEQQEIQKYIQWRCTSPELNISSLMGKSEQKEFDEKLKRLGIS